MDPGSDILDRFSAAILGVRHPVVFEIGACNGDDSAYMLDVLLATGPPFTYWVFEPDMRIGRYAEELYNRYRSRGADIRFSDTAFGAEVAEVDFYLSGGEGFVGSSSIRKPKHHLSAFPGCTFQLGKARCMTLDFFCGTCGVDHIDFVWMDVQGAEVDVLKGATQMLPRIRHIYTEYCDGELYEGEIGRDAILAMLPGFQLVKDYGGDILLRNKETTRDAVTNDTDTKHDAAAYVSASRGALARD